MKTRFCRLSPVVSVARLVTLAAAFVAFAFPASAGVLDDAKFKLDLRGDANANNALDQGEIGNAFDFSATSPSYAVYGEKGVAKPYTCENYPSQTVMRVALPLAVGKTNEQTCIYFPQEPANKYCGITIPKAAVTGDKITMYVRFRPDGLTTTPNGVFLNGFNGWATAGLGIYLNELYQIGVLTPSSTGACNITLTQGEWYDVFVVATNSADGASTGINIYACKNGASSFSKATLTRTGTYAMSINSAHALTFGSYESNTPANPRAFKGAIAEAAIWDRTLSEDEMREVMAGPALLGGEWQIGAANGSADEFDDAAPAAVYDVQSMPWCRMRKTLDSANPSLSISTTMTENDAKRNRTLALVPILSGASTAPVEVLLNGTVVGKIDLATTTSITLPRTLWRHDGLANTITIARTAPFSGTVRFDAVSLATAAEQPTGTVLEDATFKLDFRGGESTYKKPGDLGNAFDYSSASPVVGYMGDQRGPQTYSERVGTLTAQETAQVRNPYYPSVVKEQTVLHFYQDNPDATDETKGVRTGVVFPGIAPQGDVQTFYLRFRWDGAVQAGKDPYPSYLLQSGNADNANSAFGVAIMLESPSVSDDGTTTNIIVRSRVGQANGTKNFLNSELSIASGAWNDLFVTFARNEGEDKYTVTWSLCPTPAASDSGFAKAVLSKKTKTISSHPQFNSSNLTLGTYHASSSADETTRSFRGLIADFRIWERALTDDEKRQVMNGSAGAQWFVGLPNGNANEFGDDAPAAIYEPETMPWHRMRKTLDAENPTLSLRCSVSGNDVRTAKILSISPILRGGAEVSCPVAVSVNGTTIGTYDLADSGMRSILVERALWTPDANGKATVTLTRTGTVAGTLAIDHLSLCGTWQIGQDDGKSSMLDQTRIESSRGFVGDTEESRFCKSVSVGAGRASVFLDAWIPDGAEAYDWRFATDILNNYQTVDQGFTLYVNNTRIGEEWSLPAGNNANGKFSWTIPAGTFEPGMNQLQLKMTTPASGTGWAGLDYYQLRLVEPPRAFVVVVR